MSRLPVGRIGIALDRGRKQSHGLAQSEWLRDGGSTRLARTASMSARDCKETAARYYDCMKNFNLFACILTLSVICNAQQPQKKIALTPSSTVSSGEILDNLRTKQCSGVTLTGDANTADYTVEVDQKEKGHLKIDGSTRHQDYSATLFSPKGDVLFHTKSHIYAEESLRSAVMEVCKAIKEQK